MSRSIQLDIDEPQDGGLRRELMEMSKADLVALLEDATAKEVHATALSRRLMQRVATAEAANAQIHAQWRTYFDQEEARIWKEASGGSELAVEVLTGLLTRSVNALLGHTGKARTIMARFQVEVLSATFESIKHEPDPDFALEANIAEQFFVLCQLANLVPKTELAKHWHTLGQIVYEAGQH